MNVSSPSPDRAQLSREQVATMPLATVRSNSMSDGDYWISENTLVSAPTIKPELVSDYAAYRAADSSADKVKVVQGTFDDALRAAVLLTRTSRADIVDGRFNNVPHAVNGTQASAVIDAGDGSWYITALATPAPKTASAAFGNTANAEFSWDVNGSPNVRIPELDTQHWRLPVLNQFVPLDPAVKAIVGQNGALKFA